MLEQEERAESTINQQPDKITPRHRALMRKLISGMTLSEACEDIGFSVPRASIITNSPLFKEELVRMEAEVSKGFVEAEAQKGGDSTRKILSESSNKAAETLKGALENGTPALQMSAARDILDRTGYAKEDKIKATVLVEPSQSLIDVVGRMVKEKKNESGRTDTEGGSGDKGGDTQ